MSVIDDLDELNRLLSKMRISVKEEIETDEAKIIIVDSFEWIEDINEENLEETSSLSPEDFEELRKEFDKIFDLLKELE